MAGEEGGLLMYGELAPFFHVLTAPEDYDEEAKIFRGALAGASRRRIRALLELGSGGGNNASHLKRFAKMTLVDLSPGMLEVSRALNPECEHVPGDMRRVRLGRTFDAVFVHDAIGYMTTQADLLAVMETAAAHLDRDGVALFVPDFTAESFAGRTTHGGEDRDGKSLRYLSWIHDPDPDDGRYTMTFSYLVREGRGPIRSFFEEHEMGLFPRSDWLRLMRQAGFVAKALPYPHSTFDPPVESGLFVGRKR